MLLGEIIAVYCENHMNTENARYGKRGKLLLEETKLPLPSKLLLFILLVFINEYQFSEVSETLQIKVAKTKT
jgi:hypothetical protein